MSDNIGINILGGVAEEEKINKFNKAIAERVVRVMSDNIGINILGGVAEEEKIKEEKALEKLSKAVAQMAAGKITTICNSNDYSIKKLYEYVENELFVEKLYLDGGKEYITGELNVFEVYNMITGAEDCIKSDAYFPLCCMLNVNNEVNQCGANYAKQFMLNTGLNNISVKAKSYVDAVGNPKTTIYITKK